MHQRNAITMINVKKTTKSFHIKKTGFNKQTYNYEIKGYKFKNKACKMFSMRLNAKLLCGESSFSVKTFC